MKHLQLILSAAVAFSFAACKEKEATFSGGNDTVTETAGVPPPAEPEPDLPPDVPKEGDGGPLSLAPIPDKSVNAGEFNRQYSEALEVPLVTTGGEGTITFTAKVSNNTGKASVSSGTFYWTPGDTVGGKYSNEAGTHTVTITATDTKGQTATQSFKVTVKLIKWNVISRNTEDSEVDMTSDFHIFESLHPDRAYKHVGQKNGQELNTITCKAFDGSQTITLDAAPSVNLEGKTKGGDGYFDHHESLTFKFPKSKQSALGLSKMVFVTWLNFVPDPKTTISGSQPAKDIFVYFAFARCLDNDDPAACKKEAVTYKGKAAYFYCSDSTAMTTDAIYCGHATMNGVSAPGC